MSEELIDVLTSDGFPTGIRKTKSEVHRDGDWHRAAHVWIVTPDGRVLLQRRSTRKENYPGQWDVSAAGHLSAGESAVEAAIRETQEEIGLEIQPADLRHVLTTREQAVLNDGRYLDNEIYEVFIVRCAIDLASLRLDPAEVDEVRLMTVAELRSSVSGRDPSFVPHRDEYAALLKCLA